MYLAAVPYARAAGVMLDLVLSNAIPVSADSCMAVSERQRQRRDKLGSPAFSVQVSFRVGVFGKAANPFATVCRVVSWYVAASSTVRTGHPTTVISLGRYYHHHRAHQGRYTVSF